MQPAEDKRSKTSTISIFTGFNSIACPACICPNKSRASFVDDMDAIVSASPTRAGDNDYWNEEAVDASIVDLSDDDKKLFNFLYKD